jgi:hypothetical protein
MNIILSINFSLGIIAHYSPSTSICDLDANYTTPKYSHTKRLISSIFENINWGRYAFIAIPELCSANSPPYAVRFLQPIARQPGAFYAGPFNNHRE